jgi:hypothetical protein
MIDIMDSAIGSGTLYCTRNSCAVGCSSFLAQKNMYSNKQLSNHGGNI